MTKKISTRQNPLKTKLTPNTVADLLTKKIGNHPISITFADKSDSTTAFNRSTIYKDANTSGAYDQKTGLYNLNPKVVDVEGGIWYIDHLNADIPNIDRGAESSNQGINFKNAYDADYNTYSAYNIQISKSKYDETYDLLHTFFKKQSRFYLAISSDEFTKCTGAAILCPISSNYTFRKQSHINAIRDNNQSNSVVNTTFGKDVRTKKDFDSSFHTETDFDFFIETLVQGLAIDVSGTDQDYNAKMNRYIVMKDAFSKDVYDPTRLNVPFPLRQPIYDERNKLSSMLGKPSSEIQGIHNKLSQLGRLEINCYLDIRYDGENIDTQPIYDAFSQSQSPKQKKPIEYVIACTFTLEAVLDQNSSSVISYIIPSGLLTPKSKQVYLRDNEYELINDKGQNPMLIDFSFEFTYPNQEIVLDEINTVQVPIEIISLQCWNPKFMIAYPRNATLIVSPTNPKKYKTSGNNGSPLANQARYGGAHSGLIASRYTPSEKVNNLAKPEVRTSYITTEIFSLPTHYFFAMNDDVYSRKISNFQNKPLAHWQQFIIESLLPQNVNSITDRYKTQLDSLKMHPNQISATFPKNKEPDLSSARYTNNITFNIRKVQELVYSLLANEITGIFKSWLGLGKSSNFNLSSLIDLLEGDGTAGRSQAALTRSRQLGNWHTQNAIQINTFPNVKIDNPNNDAIGCFFYSSRIYDRAGQQFELDGLSMYVLDLYVKETTDKETTDKKTTDKESKAKDKNFFEQYPKNKSLTSFVAFNSKLEEIFDPNNKVLPLNTFKKDFLLENFSRLCMDLLFQYFLQELRAGNSGMTSLLSQYFQGTQVSSILSNINNTTTLNDYAWGNSLKLFIDKQKAGRKDLVTPPIPSSMATQTPQQYEYYCAYRYQEIKTFFLFSYASLSSKTDVVVSNYEDADVQMNVTAMTPKRPTSPKALTDILDFDVIKEDAKNALLGGSLRTNPLVSGETEDDVKILQASWKDLNTQPIQDLKLFGVYSFFGQGKFVVPDLTTNATTLVDNLGTKQSERYLVNLPALPLGAKSAVATTQNSSIKHSPNVPVVIGQRLYVFIGDPAYAKITNQYYFAPIVTESELSLDLTQQESSPQISYPLINGRNYQYALKIYQAGNSSTKNANNFKDTNFDAHLREVLLLDEDLYIDFSRMFTTLSESSIVVDQVTPINSLSYNKTIGTTPVTASLASPIGKKTTYLHKDQITQLDVDRFQVLGKSIIKQIFRPTYYACAITDPIRDKSINLIELFCKIYEIPIKTAIELGSLDAQFSTNLISNFKSVLSLDLLSISLAKNPNNNDQEYFVSKNLCSNAIFAFCDFLKNLIGLTNQGNPDFFDKITIENEDTWIDDENRETISRALLDLEISLNKLRFQKIENLPKVDVPIAEISSRFEALITFLSAFEECQNPLKELILGMNAINSGHVQKTTLNLNPSFELIDSMQWMFLASGVESIDDLEDVAMFAGGNLVNAVAHHAKNSKDYTVPTTVKPPKLQPIGTKDPNIFGLYDMSGNAKELVKVSEDKKEYLGTFGGSYLDEPDDLRLLNLKVGNMDSWFAKDMTNKNKILLTDARANDYKAVDVGFRFYIKYTARKPRRADYRS